VQQLVNGVRSETDASTWQARKEISLATAVMLVLGAGVGSVNGAIVAMLRLPPFIVTLGTWSTIGRRQPPGFERDRGRRLYADWRVSGCRHCARDRQHDIMPTEPKKREGVPAVPKCGIRAQGQATAVTEP